jgi:hypothetical protein
MRCRLSVAGLAVSLLGCGGGGSSSSPKCNLLDWAAVWVAREDAAKTPVAGLRIAYWPTNSLGSVVAEATTDSSGFAVLQAMYTAEPGTADGKCHNWIGQYDFGPACMVSGGSRVVMGTANVNSLYNESPGSSSTLMSMPAGVYQVRLTDEKFAALETGCFSNAGPTFSPLSSPLLEGRDVCYCACLCYGTVQSANGSRFTDPTGAMLLLTDREQCTMGTCDLWSKNSLNIYLNGGAAEGMVGAVTSGSCYP